MLVLVNNLKGVPPPNKQQKTTASFVIPATYFQGMYHQRLPPWSPCPPARRLRKKAAEASKEQLGRGWSELKPPPKNMTYFQ